MPALVLIAGALPAAPGPAAGSEGPALPSKDGTVPRFTSPVN